MSQFTNAADGNPRPTWRPLTPREREVYRELAEKWVRLGYDPETRWRLLAGDEAHTQAFATWLDSVEHEAQKEYLSDTQSQDFFRRFTRQLLRQNAAILDLDETLVEIALDACFGPEEETGVAGTAGNNALWKTLLSRTGLGPHGSNRDDG